MALVVALVIAGQAAGAVLAAPNETRYDKRTFSFDVSENMAPLPKGRFAPQAEPVHADGLPAYGNPFITMGYIYNLIETAPMMIAFVVQVRRTYDGWLTRPTGPSR
jgi:hypothetical protein